MLDFKVEIAGEHLILCPEKAIYWPKHHVLLISDAHFGKVAHFRKHGLAIPAHATLDNFLFIQQICQRHFVRQIIFLGDLFHSYENTDLEFFLRWQNSNPGLKLKLILGNHDIIRHEILRQIGLEVLGNEWSIAPFYLTHKPADTIPTGMYNLCGHIHPGAKLRLKSISNCTLPIFYFSKNRGILPAFGIFTGLHLLQPSIDDKLYAVSENGIFELSNNMRV